jgi:hypothetical protein
MFYSKRNDSRVSCFTARIDFMFYSKRNDSRVSCFTERKLKGLFCSTVRKMARVFHVSQQEKWQQCFMFHSKAGESSKQAV